jgi:hypothetical protein
MPLTAYASDDALPVGASLTYKWVLMSFVGEMTLDDPNSPTPKATFDRPGVYKVACVVSDGLKSSFGTAIFEVRESLPETELRLVSSDRWSNPGIHVTDLDGAFSISSSPDNKITVTYEGQKDRLKSQVRFTARLTGAFNETLKPGMYGLDTASGLPYGTLEFSGEFNGVSPYVTIRQLERDETGHVTRLWIVFRGDSSWNSVKMGELKYRVDPSLPDPDLPLFVHAGVDATIPVSGVASLSGSTADDRTPEANIAVAWARVEGPGEVLFDQPHSRVTAGRFGAPGDYTLRLTASAGESTATDDVAVRVLPVDHFAHFRFVPVAGKPTQILFVPGADELSFKSNDDGSQFEVLGRQRVDSSNYLSVYVDAPPGERLTPGTYTIDPSASTPQPSIRVYGKYDSWSALAGSSLTVRIHPTEDGAPAYYDLSFVLKAEDQTIEGTIVLDVSGERNTPPGVSARVGGEVVGLEPTVLIGTAWDDGKPGAPLKLEWSKVKGVGNVAFENAKAATTKARFEHPGLYTLRFSASDGELSSQTYITFEVLRVGGNFRGLLSTANGSGDGYLEASVSRLGAFSLKLHFGSQRAVIRGEFDPDGHWSGTVKLRDGGRVPVFLDYDGFELRGEVGLPSGPVLINAVSIQPAPPNVYAPTPNNYSGFAHPSSDSADVPQGIGILFLSHSKTDSISIKGVLADGTPFVARARQGRDGATPIWSKLRGGGFLAGWMRSESVGFHKFFGEMRWLQPPNSSRDTYPLGFDTEVNAFFGEASRAAVNQEVLGLSLISQPVTLRFSHPDWDSSRFFHGELRPGGELVPGADSAGLALHFSGNSGFAEGASPYLEGNLSAPTTCAIFSSMHGGAGFFLLNGKSGAVRIFDESISHLPD